MTLIKYVCRSARNRIVQTQTFRDGLRISTKLPKGNCTAGDKMWFKKTFPIFTLSQNESKTFPLWSHCFSRVDLNLVTCHKYFRRDFTSWARVWNKLYKEYFQKRGQHFCLKINMTNGIQWNISHVPTKNFIFCNHVSAVTTFYIEMENICGHT